MYAVRKRVKGHMPAQPKIDYAGGPKRRVKVWRQTDAEHPGNAERHVCVARESRNRSASVKPSAAIQAGANPMPLLEDGPAHRWESRTARGLSARKAFSNSPNANNVNANGYVTLIEAAGRADGIAASFRDSAQSVRR